MFPMATLMHRGLELAADRLGDRDAVLAGDERWTFRPRRARQQHRPPPGGRGVGPGDRVAVMTSNRVEFVAAVHGVSKLGAAAVLLSPAWKAVEVDHVGADVPRHAVADGPAAALLADRLGGGAVTDLDDPAAAAAATSPSRSRPAGPGPAEDDDAILVFSSGTTGLPKAVRHTHRSSATPRRLGRPWGWPRRPLPGGHPAVAHPRPAQPAGRGRGRRHRALHRRFDLDEVLRRIAAERITLEMAVAPIALALANHPASRTTTSRRCATSCGAPPR